VSKEGGDVKLRTVTLALFQRHRPDAVSGLRILDQTDPAPGLPYITRTGISDEELDALRTGLFAALADPELADVRADLLLKGAECIELDAYDTIRQMEKAGSGVLI